MTLQFGLVLWQLFFKDFTNVAEGSCGIVVAATRQTAERHDQMNAFWTKWAEQATYFTDCYLRHDLKKHRFLTVVINKLVQIIKQHCVLDAPEDVDPNVVDRTNYSRFFFEEKSDKVYTTAKALTRIDDRVFTLEGTIDLACNHLKDIFDTALSSRTNKC